MKNGRYFNFRDICDRNLWDTGYLVKKLQGYGILRPPLMGPQACKKRYYKTVDNADISFEDHLSNVELTSSPSVCISPKASASNSPVSSLTTLQPQKSLNQLQKPANERESTMLIGSPSRGVYVAKKNVITESRL